MQRITITGFIGKDCEVKQIGTSTAITFSVAVSEKEKNENVTTWYNCVWYNSSDTLPQYLTKGKKVIVNGDLKIRQYTSNGEKGTSINLRVSILEFIGQAQNSERSQQSPESTSSSGVNDEFKDDNLPF